MVRLLVGNQYVIEPTFTSRFEPRICKCVGYGTNCGLFQYEENIIKVEVKNKISYITSVNDQEEHPIKVIIRENNHIQHKLELDIPEDIEFSRIEEIIKNNYNECINKNGNFVKTTALLRLYNKIYNSDVSLQYIKDAFIRNGCKVYETNRLIRYTRTFNELVENKEMPLEDLIKLYEDNFIKFTSRTKKVPYLVNKLFFEECYEFYFSGIKSKANRDIIMDCIKKSPNFFRRSTYIEITEEYYISLSKNTSYKPTLAPNIKNDDDRVIKILDGIITLVTELKELYKNKKK